VFDASGALTDHKIREQLRGFMAGFSVYAARSKK
jgi:hypothetical protein